MINILTHSFTFKGIFSLKDQKFSKMIAYFLILVIILSFPLNYQIVLNNGFKGLNSFTYQLRQENTTWLPDQLPNDIYITSSGLNYVLDNEYKYETQSENQTIYTVIINPTQTINSAKDTIVLGKTSIIYFDGEGNSLQGNYQHVNEIIAFSDLKAMDKSEAREIFFSMIDNAFNPYAIFYSVVYNTVIQYLMNFLLLIVLALIMLLVRINYKRVTDFKENINIVISSMTIPTILSFIIGILGLIEVNAFLVVIFQLLTPLIALGAVYKGSKEKEVLTKGL